MKRYLSISMLAASVLLGATPSPGMAATTEASAPSAAKQCLSDLRAFNDQMRKDRFWLGGFGDTNGYGYPLSDVSGLDAVPANTPPGGYIDARAGYEIRVLLNAADILARHGQEQACEDVVASAHGHYQQYIAEMEAAHMPMANVPGWQQREIAAAQPAAGASTAYRSDQLLGTDVRNRQNQPLGSVDDLVMDPQTGKIAYLMIARGGWLFGIGEKLVAVPWDDFAIAPNAALVVLDVTRNVIAGAPQVTTTDLTASAEQRQKVDAYWEAHAPNQGGQ